MPGPAIPLAVGGILFLAYMLGKKKDESGGGTSADITPAIYTPGPEVPPSPQPAPAPASPKTYAYTIQSGDTPLGLAQAWTGQQTSVQLNALSDSNPKLQRMEMTRVRYFTHGTDPSGQLSQTGISSYATLPAGQPAGPVPLTPSSASGQNYPNNPVDGQFGEWDEDGPHMPVLSPWNPGQVVQIPASWGDPPASLTGVSVA